MAGHETPGALRAGRASLMSIVLMSYCQPLPGTGCRIGRSVFVEGWKRIKPGLWPDKEVQDAQDNKDKETVFHGGLGTQDRHGRTECGTGADES